MTHYPTKCSKDSDRPATSLTDEITPEMVSAGVAALKDFLFEGYQVFSSSHVELISSVWLAMHRALISKSPREHRRSEPECHEPIVPIVLMEHPSSRFDHELLVEPRPSRHLSSNCRGSSRDVR